MTRTARTDDQGQRDPARTRQPDWLEPELATLTQDRFSDPAWIFERKFDGERCLAFRADQQLRLMTRNQQQVTSTYPEIADALRAQEASDFIVDGEVVAFDGDQTSFSRLQRRLGVRDPGPALRAEVPVYLYVFDVLWAGGRDVRPLPLRERKRLLCGLLSFRDPLRFTEHRDTDGEAYWREACGKGWEGIIAKRADSPYRPGRTRDWLKFKCVNGQEFVIGGYTDPRGSRTGFGALLLGYYDRDGKLRYAGKVGTGFDRRTLTSLHAALAADEKPEPPFEPVRGLPRSGVHWVEPRLVAQVGFTEWTADGQLRIPGSRVCGGTRTPPTWCGKCPESLEVIEEVLLDPGKGKYDSATGEFGPDGLNGLQCGEVDLDDGFGVKDEPAGRPGALVGCGQGPAAEVLRVGEEQRRVVPVHHQSRYQFRLRVIVHVMHAARRASPGGRRCPSRWTGPSRRTSRHRWACRRWWRSRPAAARTVRPGTSAPSKAVATWYRNGLKV